MYYEIRTTDDIIFNLYDPNKQILLLKGMTKAQTGKLEEVLLMVEEMAPKFKGYPRMDKEQRKAQKKIDDLTEMLTRLEVNADTLAAIKDVKIEASSGKEKMQTAYINNYYGAILMPFFDQNTLEEIILPLISRTLKAPITL